MQLRQYLDKHRIDVPAFADELGVSAQTVYRYLTGDRLPHRDVMGRICQITKGAVQPNDWFKQVAE